ncbi:MAG: antibiotic biosynthesis monooxygenase [Azospirillaceae bacterium]|nr:antibiotic biosynthesis monooxygenase [Azospirillaceae bacterium]
MSGDGYYAVIFSSQRTAEDNGYEDMAARMVEIAAAQPGFLGIESARDPGGAGITVSYWRSLDDITRWRDHSNHRDARRRGKQYWYDSFSVRIAQVIDERSWPPAPNESGSVQEMR